MGLPTVYGYAGNVSSSAVYLPARTVGRSPATTGSQRAGMIARLWHYDGSAWRLEQQSPITAATIPAGRTSATLGALQFTPWNVGDYSVDFVVSWANSAGVVIGSLYVDENAAADYACASGAPSYCSANRVVGGSGSIWLWL